MGIISESFCVIFLLVVKYVPPIPSMKNFLNTEKKLREIK